MTITFHIALTPAQLVMAALEAAIQPSRDEERELAVL
jgi:hypothetical protein